MPGRISHALVHLVLLFVVASVPTAGVAGSVPGGATTAPIVGIQGMASPAASTAVADRQSDSSTAVDPSVRVDVRVSRHDRRTVEYRYTFAIPATVDRYRVLLYAGTVVESSGFDAVGGDRTLEWSGATNSSITVRYDVLAAARHRGCQCVVTEEWILARPVQAQFTEWVDGERTTGQLTGWSDQSVVETAMVVDRGTVSSGFVYLGPLATVESETENGRQLRVVEPDGGSRADAERVARAVRFASAHFDGTALEDGRITVAIVPRAARVEGPGDRLDSRGVTTADDYVYVDEGTGPGTWVHEYVHTRQEYTTDRSMDWYTEATAEYYGRMLGPEFVSGRESNPSDAFTGRSEVSGTLADPDTWGSQFVPYERGGRLVAYLDWRIRQATGGERSFVDVFRRLNGREHLTLDDLKRAMAAVVGSRTLDVDVDRYATMDVDPPTTWVESTAEASPVLRRRPAPPTFDTGGQDPTPYTIRSTDGGTVIVIGIGLVGALGRNRGS